MTKGDQLNSATPSHGKADVVLPAGVSRLVRRPVAMAIVGLRHAQFKELVAAGELPQPIKLTDGGRTVAWLEDELIKWRNERIAARDAAADTKKPRRAAKRGAK